MIKRRIALAYWVIALAFFVPVAAYAYIDPATTTYLIQIVTALVVTLGVSLSIFLYRFRMISSKIKYGFYGLLYRRKNRERSNREPGAEQDESLGKGEYLLPDFAFPGAEASPDISAFDEEIRAALDEGREVSLRSRTVKDYSTPKKYGGRLKMILPAVIAVCFLFIFVGCLELVVQYAPELPFELSDAVRLMSICAGAVFIVLIFVIPLFRGKLFEIIVSLGLAGLIAGYVQGNFLNTGIGELTGDAVIWSNLKPQMAASLICWIVCFVLIFLLMIKARGAWRKILFFAPILLILIQGVGFLSVVGDYASDTRWGAGVYWRDSDTMLTMSRLEELATDKNAIIFVLDRLDQDFIEEIAAEDPSFFDPLDGFTEFDDYISYAGSTFPAVCGYLTGHRYTYDVPRTDYFDDAWENADCLDAIKERGADIRMYLDRGFAYSDTAQLHGLADNAAEGKVPVNSRIVIVKLLKLSGYRYAPIPMKQLFWLAPTEFIETLVVTDENMPYVVDDFKFYERITENGLRLSNDEKSFIYYHLLGPHPPLNMDENLNYVEESSLVGQAKGCYKIVYEYLRQMKELGVYEDALIIIMGDHGNYLGDELAAPARAGLMVKPSGSYGTPLEYSHAPVCPDQLHATLMTGLFGDDGGFGDTFFDIKEGDTMHRTYSINHHKYEINGDGRDFSNWKFVGLHPDDYE